MSKSILMGNFFSEYKDELIYFGFVIGSVALLFFLTSLFHKWLVKRDQKKYPDQQPKTVNLIKKILDVLWVVLGLIALSFLFASEEQHAALERDFKLFSYLGMLSVATIIIATTTNLWFIRNINKRIVNKGDPTTYKFLRYVTVISIYFIGIMLALLAFPSLKGVAKTALGGAGVLALAVGFASKEALSNIIGGVFIISFKPFKIDDLIKVTDTMVGEVTDITLRHTIIRNFDNKMIVIPNAIINNEKLVNFDLGEKKCCERIEIGISLDSDFKVAQKIMQEECEKHPLIYDNRSYKDIADEKPLVRTGLTQINDYSLTIRAWAWGATFGDCWQLKIDVYETIKTRFDQEGIEIPTPYRTVMMKEMRNTHKEKAAKE